MSFSPPLRGINLKLPNNINWIWIKAKVHARNIFILNATWSQHCITSTASWFRFSSENRNMMCLIECFHMTSRRPYWCPKTMKRRPCWCPKPVLWELNSFLMQTLSFVPINLHICWPREWKHSIDHGRVTPASDFSYSQGNETHFMIT